MVGVATSIIQLRFMQFAESEKKNFIIIEKRKKNVALKFFLRETFSFSFPFTFILY